ncbi:unnamed protein product, partial [marine sediment metagenome]
VALTPVALTPVALTPVTPVTPVVFTVVLHPRQRTGVLELFKVLQKYSFVVTEQSILFE